jgi:AcrR family transcriptional regulator
MKPLTRLTSEQRRAAILEAVRQVFAERGFHGTTTRALAAAAGVSEALLFKHFPDKESLFSAMQTACCGEVMDRYEKVESLEPSTSTLVVMVHFLVSAIVRIRDARKVERAAQDRLTLRSLAEDGEFARLLFRPMTQRWLPKAEQCLAAAVASGDAVPQPILPQLGGWFVHNLAAMVCFQRLATPPVVDYGVPTNQLVEQLVWFALRGLGLREEAIRRDYNPRALALFE